MNAYELDRRIQAELDRMRKHQQMLDRMRKHQQMLDLMQLSSYPPYQGPGPWRSSSSGAGPLAVVVPTSRSHYYAAWIEEELVGTPWAPARDRFEEAVRASVPEGEELRWSWEEEA